MQRLIRNSMARFAGPAVVTGAFFVLGIDIVCCQSAHAKLHLNLNQIPGLRESELIYGLHAAGLGPEALAAAGADEDKAIAVVAAAASYLGNDPSAFSDSVRSLSAASAEVERLERLTRRGGSVEPAALLSARDDKAAARSHLDGLLNGLRTTAMSPLAAEERVALNSLRPNLNREVPTAFQVTERSDEEWTALRDALTNEAQAVAEISSEDQGAAALLVAVRNDEDVARAQSSLNENLAGVIDAYNGAAATLGE